MSPVQTTRIRRLEAWAPLVAILGVTGATLAQEEPPPPGSSPTEMQPPVTSRDGNLPVRPSRKPALPAAQFGVSVVGDYMFTSDLKTGGGDFSRWSADAVLSYRMFPTLDSSVRIIGRYRFADYDWSSITDGTLGAGDKPWDDINKITLGAVFAGQLNNTWSLFGGPVFEMAWESGADIGESLTGGGLIGATAKVGDGLEIGGGIGLITELEGDVRWFPVISLDWEITERLSLQNQSVVSVAGTGLELIYELSNTWEIAFGTLYVLDRFRLSESNGAFAEGVGEDSHFNSWLRLTWAPSTKMEFSVYAGFTWGGELELTDTDKNRVDTRDYEVAPTVAASFVFRF